MRTLLSKLFLLLLVLCSYLIGDPLVKTITVTTTPTALNTLLTFPTGYSTYIREYTIQVSPTSAFPIRFGECPTCTTPVSSTNGIELAAGQSFRSMNGQTTVSINVAKLGVVGVGGSATVNVLVELGNR